MSYSELYVAPTKSKAFYLWTVAAQLLGVGNRETYLAAEFPLPGTPGMNWTACNCFLIRFHTRYMVAAMLQASERGEDLWCNSFFSLQAHTTLTWKGSVSACCSFLCVPTNLWAYTWGFYNLRTSLRVGCFFLLLRFYCNKVFFFTCMVIFRLNIFEPATFFTCSGWQNLAAFRRGQKWQWKFSSSAYLQFSQQMGRFCA